MYLLNNAITSVNVRPWISNYMAQKTTDLFTHPCPNTSITHVCEMNPCSFQAEMRHQTFCIVYWFVCDMVRFFQRHTFINVHIQSEFKHCIHPRVFPMDGRWNGHICLVYAGILNEIELNWSCRFLPDSQTVEIRQYEMTISIYLDLHMSQNRLNCRSFKQNFAIKSQLHFVNRSMDTIEMNDTVTMEGSCDKITNCKM